jgi:DNA (cytosine-5)-methyltransferase 1
LAFGESDSENSRKIKQLIGGSQGQRVYTSDGLAVTQCSGSGGMGGKTGLYFIDYNPPPNITDLARCVTARQDSGVSNHKGEHSAVLVEDEPRAIINPFKETTRQNGRRIKEPNEPMFTLTVTDRHGIIHHGRIRRLMPCECWKLQGFTKEQFEKVAKAGMSDAQLYKQAGNAVTVNVVEAIARNLLEFDKELNAYGKHD